MNILGKAPIRGTFRAAAFDSAANALWTIRKLVHQYPKDNTNPRPNKIPYHSTPSGVEVAWPVWLHVVVNVSAGNPLDIAIGANCALSPTHPPTSLRAKNARGSSPITIMKN